MHFFAQVELALLPRSMEQAGHIFEMPAFPEGGTLFFFPPLESDIIHQDRVKVLFSAHGIVGTTECMPPDEIPLIDDNSYVDLDKVMPGATMLHRQYGKVETYLSYCADNPLWPDMERPSVTSKWSTNAIWLTRLR